MNWNEYLQAQGALFEQQQISSFGNAEAELAALEQKTVLCPLTQYGLIRFQGEESQPFLQGQLSSDIRALTPNAAQYSCYSTPKGRMQASFLVSRCGDDDSLETSQIADSSCSGRGV